MMAGKKRLYSLESTTDYNDSTFQSKRIFEESAFDVHRAQPSQLQSIGSLPLDTHRAKLSRQHVRALNTQFASWVQSQLQNHPDEIWEDGVQDYLDHASHIKEKFSDIVNWLKTNALKVESVFGLSYQDAPKKSVFESKDNPVKLIKDQNSFGTKEQNTFGIKENLLKENASKGQSVFGFGSQDALKKSVFKNKDNPIESVKEQPSFGIKEQPSFGIKEQPIFGVFGTSPNPPWSSGFTNTFSFGNQIAAPSNNDASNDVDGEEELQQPSSPSVKKTEEKGIIVVHEVKCKLYVKSSDPADTSTWKDKGTGQLSIKCREGVSKGSKKSKPIILVRNDVGRILLNASLYLGIKTNMQKNSIVAIFHTADESGNAGGENNGVVTQTFLIRTKTEDDRNKLASAIQEHAPAT